MIYRDTRCRPAQLMMGRQTLPTLPTALRLRWPSPGLVRQRDFDTKLSYRHNYDRHHQVRPLPPLSPGDTERVRTDNEKSWTNTGGITNRVDTPRSYTVQTESGVYRRNRRHLRVVPQSPVSRVPVGQPQLTVGPTETATDEVPLDQSPMSTSPMLRQSVRSILRHGRLVEEWQ